MFQTKRSARSARDTEGSALLLSEDASYFDSVRPSKGIFLVEGKWLRVPSHPKWTTSKSLRPVWVWLSFCTLNLLVVNVHFDGKYHSHSVLISKQCIEAIFTDSITCHIYRQSELDEKPFQSFTVSLKCPEETLVHSWLLLRVPVLSWSLCLWRMVGSDLTSSSPWKPTTLITLCFCSLGNSALIGGCKYATLIFSTNLWLEHKGQCK